MNIYLDTIQEGTVQELNEVIDSYVECQTTETENIQRNTKKLLNDLQTCLNWQNQWLILLNAFVFILPTFWEY